MIFRSTLICIMYSLPLTAMFATSSWAGCPGTWIPGRNCVCPDGSSATTSDLTNWHCPRSSRPRRAAPPKSTIPNDRSAKNARKANQEEADAEKKLAEAEKAERRTRRMLNEAKETKDLAEKTLSDANKKVAALQKRVDATNDPAKKIEVLKEQLAIKKSMLPVVRGRDQMGRSISNYENKLRNAEQTTARARAGLAQARQARIAAVTKRSPSSSFPSRSSMAKPVRNTEREVAVIKKDIAKAKSSTKRTVDNARDKWRESQRKTLDLAEKWGQAVKDGDTAKATALYADLQKAQATNKRYASKVKELESTPVDSAKQAKLLKRLNTAEQKLAKLQKEPPALQTTTEPKNRPAARNDSSNPKAVAKSAPSPPNPPAAKAVPESTAPSPKPHSTEPTPRNANAPATRPINQALARDHEKLVRLYGSQDNVTTIAEHADHASLAATAYDASAQPNISGWKRVGTAGSYDGLGSLVHGKNTASIYRKGDKYVIAFQGTNGLGDALTDVNPNSPQADWARQVARDYVQKNPNHNVTFVGHSLGGRLARLARIETGRRAVVFDSAPLLHPAAIANERLFSRNSQPLILFRAPGDPISVLTAQKNIEIKNFEHGDYSDVKNPIVKLGAKAIQSHGMDQLAATMQATKSLNEWANPDR